MSTVFWKIPEVLWVRCPRCSARRSQPCIGKTGAACPVPHTARRDRLTRVLNRLWCRGCRRRGSATVEVVAAYPCNAQHLHFYCDACMSFAMAHNFVRRAFQYEPDIECVAQDRVKFQTQIAADAALNSLRMGW